MILVQTPYGKSVSARRRRGQPLPRAPRLHRRRRRRRRHRRLRGPLHALRRAGGQDGAELVEWAADLPGSNGNVGTLGGSYLGIDQVFTAAAVGPGSPLKAIFPIATASDPYRDLFVAGGIVNMESSLGLIAGYFGLRTFTPPAERPTDLLDALRLCSSTAWPGSRSS